MSLRLVQGLFKAVNTVPKSRLLTSTFNRSSIIHPGHNDLNIIVQQVRWTTSFFNRLPASAIWKGVTSVSSAGKKRGRGKGAAGRRAKDLNRGQQIGIGPKNMMWPGLNTPVVKGREVINIQELPQDDSYHKNLMEIRNQMDTHSKTKAHVLERGWSGGFPHGQWARGKDVFPDEESLKDFVCTIIHSRLHMTARKKVGKVVNLRVLSIIGNRNGCVGFGKANADNNKDAIKYSYADAARNCIAVPICDGHTIFHDFHSRFHASKIYAYKMPPGYGLVCHRVIRAVCIAVGIKDIYVRQEGNSENYLNIVRAFISGLFNQKSFQEMADEKKLHIVEFREEFGMYPKVLASPRDGKVRKLEEIEQDEYSDFHMYINNGEVIEVTPKKYPAFVRTLGYGKYLIKYHYQRNRQLVRAHLRVKYGAVESFLTVREREERKKKKMDLLSNVASNTNEDSAAAGM